MMPDETIENVPENKDTPSQDAPYGYTKAGVPRKRPGRPSKKKLKSVGIGSKGTVGRPKGDASVINEYKKRMLASPQSRKVLQTILDAANDPEHKHQAAAWKLVMDRILPVAAFEKDVVKGAGGGKIQINISGVPGVHIDGQEGSPPAIDADWTPVNRGEIDEPTE